MPRGVFYYAASPVEKRLVLDQLLLVWLTLRVS